jgi:tRNA pseudouridine55 synthase
MNGVIVADKPGGWTSHDVVNRIRRLANTKKVGHLGTLDPMATGVLPLVVGRATRLAQFFQNTDKIYEAAIRFGWSTNTYDREGEPTSDPCPTVPSFDEVSALVPRFQGNLLQTPPPVSAKKIAGVPAYKLARKNVEVKLEPVNVVVHSIDLLGYDEATLRVRIHCGSGTYVRSIANDLGQLIGCGAFLQELRRTASSCFDLSMARTLENLAAMAEAGQLVEALIPASELLPEFPTERVDAPTAVFIRQGRFRGAIRESCRSRGRAGGHR